MQPLSRSAQVALVLAVAVCRVLAVRAFPIYDDAFITYRYALNLAHGHGLVYTPGAPWEPVLGTTTPGYAVLLALPAALGIDVVHASLALNVACDAAAAWLILRLLRARPIPAAIAVVAFAALPPLARVSVGGMEAPLFVALALASVDAAENGRLKLAGLLAVLDCSVRPEAVLLVAVVSVFYVRSLVQLRNFAVPAAILAATVALILAASYGNPIPLSVRAKAGAHGLGLHADRALAVLSQSSGSNLAMELLSPLAALGAALAFLGKAPVRAFVAFALAMMLAYAVAGAKTWGWYFYAPLTAWCLGLALGVGACIEFAWLTRGLASERRPDMAAFALAALALVATAVFVSRTHDLVTPNVYVPMQAWTRSEDLAGRGARVFSSDIGAIGFFSGATILDAEGLVWPEGKGVMQQLDVLRAHTPEYVVCVVNALRLKPFLADPISQHYEPIQRFAADGTHELHPDPAALSTAWKQDYLVFRRTN